jgi:large subunit ribosomal protein L10
VDRVQKKEYVADLKENLEGANSVVVLHYRGLSVEEISNLRNKARECGANFKVTKNSLTKLAAKDSKFSGMADLFTGPTAIAYSEDEVAAAKTIVSFAKENETVEILGGAVGEQILDAAGVKSLASVPSLDESRAKILAILNTPASQLVGVLQAPGGQVARVLSAKAAQGE